MENKTWQDIEQDINKMGLTKKRKRIPEEEKEFKHLKDANYCTFRYIKNRAL
ncbi:hypothetical protein [Treponema pedis]|uniref:hypothetical protein n=1 Tax=Treponema pedis TaxID=409322 RepID=UPI003D24D3D6